MRRELMSGLEIHPAHPFRYLDAESTPPWWCEDCRSTAQGRRNRDKLHEESDLDRPSGGSSSELPALPPAEVFNRGGQPISISPPPETRRREKAQSGGLRGVRLFRA